jgi:regulator of replication initiation timing
MACNSLHFWAALSVDVEVDVEVDVGVAAAAAAAAAAGVDVEFEVELRFYFHGFHVCHFYFRQGMKTMKMKMDGKDFYWR